MKIHAPAPLFAFGSQTQHPVVVEMRALLFGHSPGGGAGPGGIGVGFVDWPGFHIQAPFPFPPLGSHIQHGGPVTSQVRESGGSGMSMGTLIVANTVPSETITGTEPTFVPTTIPVGSTKAIPGSGRATML